MHETIHHNAIQSKTDSERQSLHIFFRVWKLDLKDKGVHKYINDCIYIYTEHVYNS
jgi:hypothetical protein